MPAALKAPLPTARKKRRAFTTNLLGRNQLTLLRQPRGRARAFTRPTPHERSTLRSCRAVVFNVGGFTLRKVRERFSAFTLPAPREHSRAFTLPRSRGRFAFTLLELLIVTGIIAVMMALVTPAFTNLKSAGDVTSAAYTIKGVLEQARTYAMANNTYAWVGFFEEDASSSTPAVLGNGRLVMSAVASIDGTNIYGLGTGAIDPTKLRQLGKLIKIDNVHLPLFAVGSGTGETFDTRPAIQFDPTAGYNYSRFGELNAATPNTAPYTTPYNFQYPVGNPSPTAQYTFKKLLQCSPLGEIRVNGNSYQVRTAVEIGLVQTHSNVVPTPTSGAGTSTATYSGNVVALQFSGFGGNFKIYRR
jgi:type II secretory pathway pseudopilin PulG